MTPEIEALAQQIAKTNVADVFVYKGNIERPAYEQITAICRKCDPKINAYLILCTHGGDAHAAYRIARALRYNYKKLTLLIPRECKSAGTLLVIGASELVVADRGELGPLDVQLYKPNEMFEIGSGLDVLKAMTVLQETSLSHFRNVLVDIKMGTRTSARIAGELATNLTNAAFAPIYAQIDPLRLGEIQRAIDIAFDYGERLDAYDHNLLPGALGRLQSAYPAHAFVIDRGEARTLFKKVRCPTDIEAELGEAVYNRLDGEGPVVLARFGVGEAAVNEQNVGQPVEEQGGQPADGNVKAARGVQRVA